ncbi:MAG: tetratricopeptide repeat protein [Blastocatellia bacterium]
MIAQTNFERALLIDKALFGEDHPNVAIRMNNLASVLKNLGQLAEARSHFEQAIRIFTNSLGAAHPYTQAAQSNLMSLE